MLASQAIKKADRAARLQAIVFLIIGWQTNFTGWLKVITYSLKMAV